MLLLRSNSYADAKCWDDLVYAFTESLRNSTLDEIIHLLHADDPGLHGWRSKYVRPVSYDRLDEVPQLLLSMAPNTLRTGSTPAYQQQPRTDIPEERIAGRKEAEAVTSGGNHKEEIDETQVNAAKAIQDVYRRRLERKRTAAKKIQDAYRRCLERKRAMAQTQIAYDRQLEREQTAARKIQAAYRSHSERKRAAAKKIQVAYDRQLERERAAAGKIQAAYLNHSERKRAGAARKIQISKLERDRVAARRIQAAYRHHLERKRARAAARRIQDAYRRHLERKRADAVRKIQAAYRLHLKRKGVVRVGVDAAQAHYWRLLRERSMEMKWPEDSRYYLLFRVPLAYILVCLDVIKAFAESGKEETKRRGMTEDNRDLEELMEALHRYRCGGVG